MEKIKAEIIEKVAKAMWNSAGELNWAKLDPILDAQTESELHKTAKIAIQTYIKLTK